MYFQVGDYIGPWTSDQQAQFAYYTEMADKLSTEKADVMKNTIPRINKGLKKDNRITLDK